MLKKILTVVAAAAMALGAVIGVAVPANASGLNDSYTVINVADRSGALVGDIGILTSEPQTKYTLGRNSRLSGPEYNTWAYPKSVRAGAGYCVWEELWSRPTGSTGEHSTFVGNFNYGQGYSYSAWFTLQGYTRTTYPDKSWEDKDYWGTLRIFAC